MTAPGPTGPGSKNAARRSPWVAALLSPFTPGLGHLYGGQPKAAVAVAGIVLAGQAIILAASLIPPTAPAIGYLQLGLLALYLLLLAGVAVHAVFSVRRTGAVTLRRYNRPPAYLLVLAAWIAEYQIYGRVEDAVSASTTYPVMAGAMEPTLIRDDLVFGHKGYYDAHAPAYGDVVAIRNPGDRTQVWLLRIVGLPGDRVRMAEGRLQLNGEPVQRQPVSEDTEAVGGSRKAFSIVTETLPGGATYRISEQVAAAGVADNTPEQAVPPGHVFLLGDNRDNATDSRILGPVPIADLESRLTFIFWSREDGRTGKGVQPGE